MGSKVPLASLDDLDWPALQCASDSAEEILTDLHKLQSASETESEDALSSLIWKLTSDGRYSASVAAAPFICKIAASSSTLNRVDLVRFIPVLALGSQLQDGMRGFNIKQWRETVAETQLHDFPDMLLQERTMFIESAQDPLERHQRERQATSMLPAEVISRESLLEIDTYDAVRSQLDTLLDLLADPSPSIRREIAYALACFPEDMQTIEPALLALVGREQDETVKATALVAIGHLRKSSASHHLNSGDVLEHCQRIFRDRDTSQFVHWASAVTMALLGTPDPEHVDMILRKLCEPDYLHNFETVDKQNKFPFAGGSLTSLAVMVLRDSTGDNMVKLLQAIIIKLPRSTVWESLNLAEVALDALFPPAHAPPLANSLTSIQRDLIHALTKVQDRVWDYREIRLLLKRAGLPVQLRDLEALVGVDSLGIAA